jgi:hypothetical protein
VLNVHRNQQEQINGRIKLLSGVIGASAATAMAAVFVASGPQPDTGTFVANAPGDITTPRPVLGETSTQETAPTTVQIPKATPPVTAEPAPTEEPG